MQVFENRGIHCYCYPQELVHRSVMRWDCGFDAYRLQSEDLARLQSTASARRQGVTLSGGKASPRSAWQSVVVDATVYKTY